MADEAEAKAAGFTIGFVSPASVKGRSDTLLIVDPDAAQGVDSAKGKPMFWAAGADEADHHVKFFNWRRELGDALDDASRVRVADIRNAEAGDPSPKDPSVALEASRGIEVGHIFKLGTKYSDAMDFRILDEKQELQSVIMGCYGIGVSRTMAACVEMSHDEGGIVWPAAIAPYHVHLVVMDVEPGGEAMVAADEAAEALAAAGYDVLIDDRDERPGPKFKDADLIGIPVRVTVGKKALEQGGVELKARTDAGKGEIVPAGEIVERVGALLG
jgi:prolyl-tRNA synthetase